MLIVLVCGKLNGFTCLILSGCAALCMVAREREVKDTLEADFRKSLGEKLSQREKAVTGLLKAQHAKDIQALEAKWAAKLETKEDELAKQKNIIAEVRATILFQCFSWVMYYIPKLPCKAETLVCVQTIPCELCYSDVWYSCSF